MSAAYVNFDLPDNGRVPFSVPRVAGQIEIAIPVKVTNGFGTIRPNYTDASLPGGSDNDIAVLKLTDQLLDPNRLLVKPFGAQSYRPFDSPTLNPDGEIGRLARMVGYGMTGIGSQGSTVALDYKKRLGHNIIELVKWKGDAGRVLVTDFDDGTAPHDAFGIREEQAGTGVPMESAIARGDSGGPWFAMADGVNQYIVGVTSVRDRYSDSYFYNQPDINAGIDSTFGEVSVATRVGPQFHSFIQPSTTGGAYDLVLDFAYQVYGRSNPAVGVPDNLTVTVRKGLSNGTSPDYLFIEVTDGTTNGYYNGLYYAALASNIKSLTLRGTSDNEKFVIVGDLGIQGGVYVDGGGAGLDEVIYDDSGATAVRDDYTFAADTDLGHTLRMHRAVGAIPQALPSIQTKSIGKFTLLGSPGSDVVAVEAVPASLADGLFLLPGAGDDSVYVGSAAKGWADHAANVFADGGAGSNTLTYRDTASSASNTYTMGLPEAQHQPAWSLRFARAGTLGTTYSKSFAGYEVRAGSGNDQVRLDATVAPTVVFAGAGNDTVTVGSAAEGLKRMAGEVRVSGEAGSDGLVVEDRAGTSGVSYDVSSGWVERYGVPKVYNTDAVSRTLYSAAGGTTIGVSGNLADPEAGLTVVAGTGTDLVRVSGTGSRFDDLRGAITIEGGAVRPGAGT